MNLMHRLKEKWHDKHKWVYIGLMLVGLVGPVFRLEAAAQTSMTVVSETGKDMPSEGSVWLAYNLGPEQAGFKGNIVINKQYYNLYASEVGDPSQYIRTVYPLALEKGVYSGKLQYRLGSEQNYDNNQWRYNYEIQDATGKVLSEGTLGTYNPSNTLNRVQVLVIGEDQGQKDKIRTSFTNSLILVKNNFDGEDGSFLKAYSTIFISHEEALSLSKQQQEQILKQVNQGARLIVTSPKGHSKMNFAEAITKQSFTETGMSNLKDLANLIGSGNETKDFWLETAKTSSGSIFNLEPFGKGSIVQLGFDPFQVGENQWEVAEDKILQTLLMQSSMNVKPTVDHYALSNQAMQLPVNMIPKFGLMMFITAVVLLITTLTGVYMIKVKRLNNGMLIAVASAAGISLVVIWGSGIVSGYRGSLINEVSLNSVSEEGFVDSISYIGVKSNKAASRLVMPVDLEVWSSQNGYYTSRGTRVNQVGEKSVWELPRADKWQIDLMSAKPSVIMPKVETILQNIQFEKNQGQGLIQNPTEEDWLNVILIIDGQWAALGDLPKGSSVDIAQAGAQFESVASAQGQFFGRPDAIKGTEKMQASQLDVTQYSRLMETAFNQGNPVKVDQLIYFTQGEGNLYELEGEKPLKTYLRMNRYAFKIGEETLKSSYQLSDFHMISGIVYTSDFGINNDISLATPGQSATFICNWKPNASVDKNAWEVSYSGERLANLRIFNVKTGQWQVLRPKETLRGTELRSQFMNPSGEVYFKIDAKSLYFTPADFSLLSKGVE